MPASFLHGVETIEITKGARTIQTVKTAVIGIIGTAPIDEVEEQYRTINEPTLILNETEAVKYFGKSKSGFTIPDALNAIFDQGAGIAIVINVFNPAKHESVEDVRLSDIIGGVDAITGKRYGLKAFEDCYSLFGYYPKTIIAPVYCEEAALVPEINIICNKIRAIGLVDAPVGASVQDVITGRGSQGTINFNTSSERIAQTMSIFLSEVIAYKSANDGEHWYISFLEMLCHIGRIISCPVSFFFKDNLLNSSFVHFLLKKCGLKTTMPQIEFLIPLSIESVRLLPIFKVNSSYQTLKPLSFNSNASSRTKLSLSSKA